MLNKKGFTLIELLAVMVVLAVLMRMTVPNIIGITTANKKQMYAEDAKKMVSTVEYMLRGDDAMTKPVVDKHCVVVSLSYIGMEEFKTAPYEGQYDPYESYVVMYKNPDRVYEYYVQLYERLPDGEGWRGFRLLKSTDLEGDNYIDLVDEVEEAPYLRTGNNSKYLFNLSVSDQAAMKKNIAKRVNKDFTGDTICYSASNGTGIDEYYFAD